MTLTALFCDRRCGKLVHHRPENGGWSCGAGHVHAPSRSYPYLWAARVCGASYRDVMNYATALDLVGLDGKDMVLSTDLAVWQTKIVRDTWRAEQERRRAES